MIEAFKGFPKLCGCENYEQWAWVIGAIYKEELVNGESAFTRKDGDLFGRAEVAFAFKHYATDKDKAEHCINLMKIAMLKHYAVAHGEDVTSELLELTKTASANEARYSDISAIAPLDSVAISASTMWAG